MTELQHLNYFEEEPSDRGAEISKEGERLQNILKGLCNEKNALMLTQEIVKRAMELDYLVQQIKDDPVVEENWAYDEKGVFSNKKSRTRDEAVVEDGLMLLKGLVVQNLDLTIFTPLDSTEKQSALLRWIDSYIEIAKRKLKDLKERGTLSGNYLLTDNDVILPPLNSAAKEKEKMEKGIEDEDSGSDNKEWIN